MVGFGASGTDVVLLSTTARWFVKKRGLMSGIVKVGTGIGMTAMPVVVSGLIAAYGWRNAFLIAGAIILPFIVLVTQFLRRDPSKMHQFPDGSNGKADYNELSTDVGLSFQQAGGTPQLWMLCLAYLVIFLSGNSILVHVAPHAIDIGISGTLAATMISTFGGASIIGRFAMGFTCDKVGSKRALIICFIVAITGLVWLQFARELWPLYLFSVVYGFSHGGFFALMSPIVAELFGTRSHGVILGIVIFSGSLGGATGPLLSGYIFDMTGSYSIAFLLLLSMAVIGAIMTILLKPTILDRIPPAPTPNN